MSSHCSSVNVVNVGEDTNRSIVHLSGKWIQDRSWGGSRLSLHTVIILVYSENLHPFFIVEISLTISEGALQKSVYLFTISNRPCGSDNPIHTSDWPILSPVSLNHFLISSHLTVPESDSSKDENASTNSASASNSNRCSLIMVKNMAKLIPRSSAAEDDCKPRSPGRDVSSSSIISGDGAMPRRVER